MKHAESASQHAERQQFRVGMALAMTGIALDMAGLLPSFFLCGVGVGWLLSIALQSMYNADA